MRGLVVGRALAGEILAAEIVREDEDNVGLGRGECGNRKGKKDIFESHEEANTGKSVDSCNVDSDSWNSGILFMKQMSCFLLRI